MIQSDGEAYEVFKQMQQILEEYDFDDLSEMFLACVLALEGMMQQAGPLMAVAGIPHPFQIIESVLDVMDPSEERDAWHRGHQALKVFLQRELS